MSNPIAACAEVEQLIQTMAYKAAHEHRLVRRTATALADVFDSYDMTHGLIRDALGEVIDHAS